MEEKFYIYEGKIQKKRPALKLTCPVCGREFLKAKHNYDSDVKRGVKNHYCSRDCAQKAREDKVELKCDYCGKTIYKKPSSLRNSRSGLYFCSRACKEKAQSLNNDPRFDVIRPDHYGKGTYVDYRELALLNKEPKCERCGYSENIAALQVHHKDHNRKNNSLDNLEVLCANCHAIEHWGKH